MPKATKDQIVELVDQFLTDQNLWNDFKRYAHEQGYRLIDLGFVDTEDEGDPHYQHLTN